MVQQESVFVKILLPQKPFVIKEVESVEIPAINGNYLVLPLRAPTMKVLTNGILVLKEANKSKTEKYFISSGVAKIRENACTVLTNEIIKFEEVNIKEINERLAVFKEKEIEETHLDLIDQRQVDYLEMIVGAFAKNNLS